MKVCFKCKQEKPEASFNKDSSKKDGLTGMCRECIVTYQKKYYQKHKSEVLAKQHKYFQKTKLQRAKTVKKHYQDNRAKYISLQQERYRKNKEYYYACVKVWRQKPESKQVLAVHAHRRRALKTAAGGSFTVQEFETLCIAFQWKCAYCETSLTPKTVTRDHVIPLTRGGSNHISNILPSCLHCNCSKGNKTLKEWKRDRPEPPK